MHLVGLQFPVANNQSRSDIISIWNFNNIDLIMEQCQLLGVKFTADFDSKSKGFVSTFQSTFGGLHVLNGLRVQVSSAHLQGLAEGRIYVKAESSNVIVSNCSIMYSSGCIIYASGSNVTINNVFFTNNHGQEPFVEATDGSTVSLSAIQATRNLVEKGTSFVCVSRNSSISMLEVEVNNNSVQHGSFFLVSQSSQASITNCSFTGNRGLCGGTVQGKEESSIVVTDSQFTSNTAFSGGAICVHKQTSVMVFLSTFCENTAQYLGVESSDFTGRNGGAIYSGEHSILNVTSSVFTKNFVPMEGSRSQLPDLGNLANLLINGSVDDWKDFNDNFINKTISSPLSGPTTGGNGGAICVNDSSAHIIQSQFKNNSAARNGGAIFQFLGQVVLINSHFCFNTAQKEGGVLHNGMFGVSELNSSSFVENSAGSNAAVTLLRGKNLSVFECTFSKNFLMNKQIGGVVLFSTHSIFGLFSTVILQDSIFTGNEVFSVLFLNADAILAGADVPSANKVINTHFIGNQNSAVCLTGIALSIESCLFENNTAQHGGAISMSFGYDGDDLERSLLQNFVKNKIFWNSSISVATSSFIGNRAKKGGAVYCQTCFFQVEQSQFVDNLSTMIFLTGHHIHVLEKSSVAVANCEFSVAHSTGANPVILLSGYSKITLSDLNFSSHSVFLYVTTFSYAVVSNSTFSGASYWSSLLSVHQSSLVTVGLVFVNLTGPVLTTSSAQASFQGCTFQNIHLEVPYTLLTARQSTVDVKKCFFHNITRLSAIKHVSQLINNINSMIQIMAANMSIMDSEFSLIDADPFVSMSVVLGAVDIYAFHYLHFLLNNCTITNTRGIFLWCDMKGPVKTNVVMQDLTVENNIYGRNKTFVYLKGIYALRIAQVVGCNLFTPKLEKPQATITIDTDVDLEWNSHAIPHLYTSAANSCSTESDQNISHFFQTKRETNSDTGEVVSLNVTSFASGIYFFNNKHQKLDCTVSSCVSIFNRIILFSFQLYLLVVLVACATSIWSKM